MSLEGWGAVAFVIVSLEAFIILLIPLAIVFLLNRGLGWLRRKVGYYSGVVFGYFRQAHDIVNRAMRVAVAPIIAVNSFFARVHGLVAGIRKVLHLDRRYRESAY